MRSNFWGSSARLTFVSPDSILFMIEKGWTKTELDEMDGNELKFWYIETINKHNRDVKRQSEANK